MVVVNRMRLGQTFVPNVFIDKYLAAANGEYVKVYIMILRLIDEGNLSVESLADALDIPEKDIMRALGYWEKQGLISTEFENEKLIRLVIMDLPDEKSEVEVSKEPDQKRLDDLMTGNGDFKQLLYVSERYLSRTISMNDMKFLAWVFDELGFSLELSEYLVEYCAGLNKTSVSYMRSVALSWKKQGVKDIESARTQINNFTSSAKKGTKSSSNKFHNFNQREDDLNALVYGEMKNVHN